jgi:hypothetical protein
MINKLVLWHMSLPRFHVSYWSLANVRTTKWRVYNWISTKFSKPVFALYGPLHRKWLNWFILFITRFHNLMIIATTLGYRHTLIAMWCLYYRTNIMPLLLIGSVSYTHLYCLINARRSDLACGKELKHILVFCWHKMFRKVLTVLVGVYTNTESSPVPKYHL